MENIGIATLNHPRNKIHLVTPKKGTAICTGRTGDLFGDVWFDTHEEAWDALIESGHGCLHCQNISKRDAERLTEMYDGK